MRLPVRPAVVALLAFAYLMTYPLVIGRADESHLLHGARRVLDGEVIYRDFFEIITPLAFYFIAAVYRIGGTTLRAARTAMALVDAVGAAALFTLVRVVAGTPEAILAVLVLVGLCIPVWGYASAHWMSTTLALVVATVLFGGRSPSPSRSRALAAGLLAGTAVCVQQQRGVFLVAWMPVALALLAAAAPRGMRWRTMRRDVVAALGGATLVVAVVIGLATWAASPAAVYEMLYEFAAQSYGAQKPGTFAWAGKIALTDPYLDFTWYPLFRMAPLFLVGEGLALLRHVRPPWPRAVLVRASCWGLGVCMAVSVWYLPDFIHVAFVMPFLVVPAAALVYELRTWRGWARVPGGRAVFAIALGGAGVALAIKSAGNVALARSRAPVRFETAFGTLEGDEYVERVFDTVRRHLVPEPTGRSRLYSYPDDAWLFLALPADAAARLDVLTIAFPRHYFDEVVAVLRARRPGTVLMLSLAKTPVLDDAIAAGYDLAEQIYPYNVYVRRASSAGTP